MSNKELADKLLAEKKITQEQADQLKRSPSNWDYIPGEKGENAFVLACAGIPPSSGLYGQDLYQVLKLSPEDKDAFNKLRATGMSIQTALQGIGVIPYAPAR